MKNTLFALLLTSFSFGISAQEKALISTEAIAKCKSQGVFELVIPTTVTQDMIAESAAKYTTYFTVDFDKKSHAIAIKLTKNEEMNKRVITRFLMSVGLENVTIMDKQVRVDELYDLHLKSETK